MFSSCLGRAASLRGGQLAFQCDGFSLDWATLVDRAGRLAGGLAAMGISRGDRLATVLPNGLQSVELFAVSAWSGVVIVPLNYRWTSDELAYALADSGAKAIVADEQFGPAAAIAAAHIDIPLFGLGEGTSDGPCYTDLMASKAMLPVVSRPDDLLGIFYTGGTTGHPKGVMLSHGNLTYNVLACMAEGLFAENETYLHVSPIFHIAGALAIYASFASGCRGVLLPRFDAKLVLATIASESITQTLMVPTMIEMVIGQPDFESTDTSAISNVLYGAAPISEALLIRAMAGFRQAAFTQLYGMTETSPTSAILHSREFGSEIGGSRRIRSSGRAIYGTEIRTVRPDGTICGADEMGEIVVRGPGVMLGYWNQPEKTAEAVRDHWMHTGDGGRLDADGFLFLADRLKDMIISGGENVFSIEVENVIMMHEGVAQCAIIGIPHPIWGEAVHAIIVPRDGSTIDADEILAFCKKRLAGFKQPRTLQFRDTPLPASAAGKILKRDLRAPFWEPQSPNSPANSSKIAHTGDLNAVDLRQPYDGAECG